MLTVKSTLKSKHGYEISHSPGLITLVIFKKMTIYFATVP